MSKNSFEPSRPDVGVVVVAAGRGLRAGAGPAKQFRPIAGVPMLLRSLRPFLMHPAVHVVVVVVPVEVAAKPPIGSGRWPVSDSGWWPGGGAARFR